MMNPLVSVIIPCFNHARFLPDCLESVFQQTYPHVEIIVVNDGSTDDTASVAKAYGQRIKYLEQSNQGLSAARNAGLRVASGEFVNFLDADDALLPAMINESVQCFASSPEAGVIHSGFIFGNEDLTDLSWTVSPSVNEDAFQVFAHWVPLPCQSMLFRTSVLRAAGEFDVSLRACEDWDMWFRIARSGVRWASIPTTLSIVRMRAVSMSRDAFGSFRAGQEVIRRAHREDPRVKSSHPPFAGGCPCPGVDALWSWLLNCTSFAIAQGNVDTACALLAKEGPPLKADITAADTTRILHFLWYATATPFGKWDVLWPKVRQPLLDFLLRLEVQSGRIGLSCQTLGMAFRKPGEELEAYSGRELLHAVGRKLRGRLLGP